MQFAVPFTPMVKRLIIINSSIWIGGVLILQNIILKNEVIYKWFGFVPNSFFLDFWVWQPFTYMFIHSNNIFHVIFNMVILWMFGAELEMRLGSKKFLFYYLACGVGAAILYFLGVFAYYMISGNSAAMESVVVGASGAIFGLMVAYGKYFGDRQIFFMMMIPMKARVFVAIIGGIEVLNLLNSGLSSQTANLAHLAGLVMGLALLWIMDRWPKGPIRKASQKRGRNLKLVVDNEDRNVGKTPRFWN